MATNAMDAIGTADATGATDATKATDAMDAADAVDATDALDAMEAAIAKDPITSGTRLQEGVSKLSPISDFSRRNQGSRIEDCVPDPPDFGRNRPHRAQGRSEVAVQPARFYTA